MQLSFNKFQGAGNDFILLDIRETDLQLDVFKIKFLCDRRFGIGADGLITLGNDDSFPFFMRYYNSDGNESTMCGNGGRCIALFANMLNLGGNELLFNAIDGQHMALILDRRNDIAEVKLKMKDVNVIEKHQDYLLLNTGSPHYVCFRNHIQSLDVKAEGRKIRYSENFLQHGINVNFVERIDTGLFVRTYERGVEDETFSCGTGVTASVLASTFLDNKITSAVKVLTLGGELKVHFQRVDNEYKNIWLEGPAVKVYSGTIEI